MGRFGRDLSMKMLLSGEIQHEMLRRKYSGDDTNQWIEIKMSNICDIPSIVSYHELSKIESSTGVPHVTCNVPREKQHFLFQLMWSEEISLASGYPPPPDYIGKEKLR